MVMNVEWLCFKFVRTGATATTVTFSVKDVDKASLDVVLHDLEVFLAGLVTIASCS